MNRLAAFRICIVQALLIFLFPNVATSADGDSSTFQLGGSVTVASDYVFRGISQTMGRPALQASVDLEHDNGFYAYAWATNVDFFPDAEPDDGARTEINLAAGYVIDIGDRWSVDTSIVRYIFPGTRTDVNYDYNDLISTLRFDDRFGVTVAYAKDVDGTATDSFFSEVSAGFELPLSVAMDVAYGYYDLSAAYGTSYDFVKTSLSRGFGETSTTLTFYSAFSGSDQIFFEQAEGSRLVFTIDISF